MAAILSQELFKSVAGLQSLKKAQKKGEKEDKKAVILVSWQC